MQATELVARYRGAGGTVHAVGVDAAAALVGVERVQPYDGTRAAAEVDLLVVSAPDGPGLRALVPTDLPVGCHVALLAAGGAGNLAVGLLLDVLGDARVQVVDAVALAGSGEATVAVVGVRTDTALVPPPSHADAVVGRVASGDAALSRLVGEA